MNYMIACYSSGGMNYGKNQFYLYSILQFLLFIVPWDVA